MKLCFPLEILKQHLVVLGKTGKGKSSVLRHIVEHLLAHNKRVCVIDPKGDWYGLKSSADGKSAGFPVIAFGDFKDPKASDVPINFQSGRHVAELVTSGNRPCVIGFRGWMPNPRTKFWVDFASTLFNANSGELYLVGDEFHNFAPKGRIEDPDAGMCLHWSNRIMSEGRGVGLICLIASQRPQKVHNDALTCCETLVAMGVNHPADRAAVKDWIDGCGDKEQGNLILNSLAGMGRGEAYVWSPENSFGPKRISFPMFETFDSFAPPQLQKRITESGWAAVDLSVVREKLQSVIAEEKANDPAELKREITRLKKELTTAAAPAAIKTETKEVSVFTEADRRLIDCAVAAFESFKEALITLGKKMASVDEIGSELRALRLDKITAMRQPAPAKSPAFLRNPSAAVQPRPVPTNNRNNDIRGGLQRMMIALAQRPGLNRKQLGLRSGLSSNSGTFDTYLSRMRSNGWLEGNGEFRLTDAGLSSLGTYQPLPEGEALLQHWLNHFGASGAARMLLALADAYPGTLTREQLGALAGLSHQSGSFDTYLSRLRGLELVEGRADLQASKEFFT